MDSVLFYSIFYSIFKTELEILDSNLVLVISLNTVINTGNITGLIIKSKILESTQNWIQ